MDDIIEKVRRMKEFFIKFDDYDEFKYYKESIIKDLLWVEKELSMINPKKNDYELTIENYTKKPREKIPQNYNTNISSSNFTAINDTKSSEVYDDFIQKAKDAISKYEKNYTNKNNTFTKTIKPTTEKKSTKQLQANSFKEILKKEIKKEITKVQKISPYEDLFKKKQKAPQRRNPSYDINSLGYQRNDSQQFSTFQSHSSLSKDFNGLYKIDYDAIINNPESVLDSSKIKEKAHRVANIATMINVNDDIHDMLKAQFGKNVLEDLMETGVSLDFIKKVENAVNNFEKKKDNDSKNISSSSNVLTPKNPNPKQRVLSSHNFDYKKLFNSTFNPSIKKSYADDLLKENGFTNTGLSFNKKTHKFISNSNHPSKRFTKGKKMK